MSEASQSVAKLFESGEYIQESRAWYFNTYRIAGLHSMLITLVSLLSLVITFAVGSLIVENYSIESYPFPIYFGESQDVYYPHIKALARSNESVNDSIARYLVGRYIASRESYDPIQFQNGEWDEKTKFLKRMSSHHTFNQYARSIDVKTNLESPIIKYKLYARRDIAIKKVQLIEDSNLPIAANITFTSTEVRPDQEDVVDTWKAYLEFSMTDLEQFEHYDKIQLQFVITRYNLEHVS